MTGVPYWPYAIAFLGGHPHAVARPDRGPAPAGPPPSNGYVLDINAVRAHAAAAQPQQHKRAA